MEENVEANEKLKKGCQDALQTFRKIDDRQYDEIQSKLEYVIGSYEYDKNPVGLHEIGTMALQKLKDYKEKNPRKVSKKNVENFEKCLNNYQKAQ